MAEVIEAHYVVRHQSQNGSEVFTINALVSVRYGDLLHYNGRRYVVERVEEVKSNGCHVVRAAYRGKL